MKKTSIALVSLTMSLLAATLVAPNTALAQSGSRLCGWYATMDDKAGTQAIAFLTELRETDLYYAKQCSESFLDEKLKKNTENDATLNGYKWIKVKKATCESVGEHFTSATQTSTDICNSMNPYTPYKVVKLLVSTVINVPATTWIPAKNLPVNINTTIFEELHN